MQSRDVEQFLSNKSFIKQNESMFPGKESRLSGNQKQPRNGNRVGFFRVVVPPCVLCYLTS